MGGLGSRYNTPAETLDHSFSILHMAFAKSRKALQLAMQQKLLRNTCCVNIMDMRNNANHTHVALPVSEVFCSYARLPSAATMTIRLCGPKLRLPLQTNIIFLDWLFFLTTLAVEASSTEN